MSAMNGRVAVISGAGTGLGRATAIEIARKGAAVVLLGRRKSKLDETAALIAEEHPGSVFALQTDVSDEQQVNRSIAAAIEKFRRIDVLINNAAIFEPGRVGELTVEEWERQLAINLTGPFLMTRAVLPIMRQARYGRIVNITSGLAFNGAGGYAAYSASKAGLESFTRTLADEEESHNILANLYNPGTLRSEMHRTGKDPALVNPGIIRLATLPQGGITGTIVTY
ncbi:SDR family NAD(P)-dependent oxidoreductase [Paenibacillus spongiae]|uniref:SDR family oxidoreductase n=1 Tax=Paenibacillus spongiae TaxID=2909671 RepID=A0ABY5S7L5_9BACL|nr:SDR family oxidoreductase [Paenibacillus spongiae]UVI28713.1 SDR family oxidoreductase [Paenibacillus spongiae]